MTVRVHGRNMQVPQEIRVFAEDRLEHAGRIFDDGSAVDVEFSESRNPRIDEKYTVEITTHVAGHIVRIEADASDERSAVDTAADKYERQLRRLKERLIQRNRSSNKDLNHTGDHSDVSSDRGGGIVRTKRFAMKPMTAEEAVLQMEMLGHDFFFFLDAESDRHCVVYHRRDGNVGLIEPE
ncbi:MAG: ribosome hibernation-promoting factor, HPF/YfiA family [Acidimicrobiia bacterium]